MAIICRCAASIPGVSEQEDLIFLQAFSYYGEKNVPGARLQWEIKGNLSFSQFSVFRKQAQDSAFVLLISKKGNERDFTFTDVPSFCGTYYYEVKGVSSDGTSVLSNCVEITIARQERFDIINVYPNPAETDFKILFRTLSRKDLPVKVMLYDRKGDLVFEKTFQSGTDSFLYEENINISGFASGIYIIKAVQGTQERISKIKVR